ncbi:MAG: hypothetical protein KAT10_00310 [Sulfurimonas sp.]|nr:hypothetical protein [Sulfurimonas sp.]
MKLIIILLLFTGLFASHDIHHINKELSHLELSEQQNKKIKKLLQEFRMELKDFRDYKKAIEDKRKKLFTKDILNIEQLNKLNNELYKKTNEIEIKLLNSIHLILNKKQRSKFIYYFNEWKVK